MEKYSNTDIVMVAGYSIIYRYSIFISSSLLEKDFEELMQRYLYDYIELQLDFAMDLYPFFPPLVKVIRPRLQGMNFLWTF